MGTFAAIVAIISRTLQLVTFLTSMMHDREQQGIGRTQALAEALQEAHKALALADAAQIQADQAHAKDPTDNAFDRDFMRVN